MKKFVIIGVILALMLTAAICTLPYSKERSFSFSGAAVSADGTVLEACSIALGITELQYLLREDVYDYVELQIGEQHFDSKMYTSSIPAFNSPDSSCELITLVCYNEEANAISDKLTICLSYDRDWCFIRLESHKSTQYFAGSVGGTTELDEILTICSVWMD